MKQVEYINHYSHLCD